jgi:hypothetical protein
MVKKLYRRIPILRELLQIRDAANEIRDHAAALRTLRAQEYLASLKAGAPRYTDSKRLICHGFQVNSQNEEDGMIAEVFRRVGTTDKVFVEIGVGDGSENNTAFLLGNGWTGFWLDGDVRFLETISRHGRELPSVLGWAGMISEENAVPVLSKLGVPESFDLLSVDIDHSTYHVWATLGRKFKPRVVVAEYNATLPASTEWVAPKAPDVTWDGTMRFGGSLKSFELLGAQLGYSLVGCDLIGANAFFVRDDLVGDHFCKPFTSENHYEPARYFAIHRRTHRASMLT